MENAEEIYHFLDDFSKRKPKVIPQELNDYLAYVARTGDPVYQWSLVKSLFKEKLLNVITDFYDTTPGIEIPPYPNVDPFNYDIMKNSLLERLDSFTSAPFTVQRISELLTSPRKQYNRVDKFMRAIEKNILVVSTREPGPQRQPEPENGESGEPIVNGSDNNSEYNVDVEMEDMSWKENNDQVVEPQPSSSDTHISVDDLEARLQAKQNAMDTQEKTPVQYESVTPPELNVTTDDEVKSETPAQVDSTEVHKPETVTEPSKEPKVDIEMKVDEPKDPLIIPEIKVDDAEVTEQRLIEESEAAKEENVVPEAVEKTKPEKVAEIELIPIENTIETNPKDEEPKILSTMSEVSNSSEESSSSDNTDGNSNSPKTDETPSDSQEESNPSDSNLEETKQTEPQVEITKEEPVTKIEETTEEVKKEVEPTLESDKYSVSDVGSVFPQSQDSGDSEETKNPEVATVTEDNVQDTGEQKPETNNLGDGDDSKQT